MSSTNTGTGIFNLEEAKGAEYVASHELIVDVETDYKIPGLYNIRPLPPQLK